MSTTGTLPPTVHTIELADKKIYVVATAHVSAKSIEDVIATVEYCKPDTIAIELCQSRYQAMKQRDNWAKMDVFKVLKEKKAAFLVAQLLMSSFYRKLGDSLGVEPGAEMKEGINQAEKTGAQLVLADRPIDITLKRVWGNLSFWEKMRLAAEFIASIFSTEKIEASAIEDMKSADQLESLMESFAEQFPKIKQPLIDERDMYLSEKLRSAPGKCIVAVVGAGHVPGMKKQIQKPQDLEAISTLPPPSKLLKAITWGVPALIIALFIAGFAVGGGEKTAENAFIWVLSNGILSAIGAAAALAHPLTIITAFVAAPLTSLNPTIGAGMVTGIVQAWLKKPTVADLEQLPAAISSAKGWWSNPTARILLVFVFSSLGSALGTYLGTFLIAKNFF